MEHARLRKPAVSQGEDTLPGEWALLASAAEGTPFSEGTFILCFKPVYPGARRGRDDHC